MMAATKEHLPLLPKYELVYFDFRARAELCRLLFALADKEYTDTRVTSIEQWLALKAGKSD